MSNKYNNDDSQKEKLESKDQRDSKLQDISRGRSSQRSQVTQPYTSNRNQQWMSLSKTGVQQSPSNCNSIVTQTSSIILPVTIQQLTQKSLNNYMKQFMQISTFQGIQKGKQLVELIKQAPMSKQTGWVTKKALKLFKSRIPQAVLCSFQFFRELIQIAHYQVTDALQQILLMPVVQIIEYRCYIPHIQRGNNYFLNQFSRYSNDQKINHVIKIGSTFFRMVHESLFVWGTFYFPESNFKKMLKKLQESANIKFPKYPEEFKFYSRSRIDLFLITQQKNKQSLKSEQEEYRKKKLAINKRNANKEKDEIIQRVEQVVSMTQGNFKKSNVSQQVQNKQTAKIIRKQQSAQSQNLAHISISKKKKEQVIRNQKEETHTIGRQQVKLKNNLTKTQKYIQNKQNKDQKQPKSSQQSKKQSTNSKKIDTQGSQLSEIQLRHEKPIQKQCNTVKQKDLRPQNQKVLEQHKRMKPRKSQKNIDMIVTQQLDKSEYLIQLNNTSVKIDKLKGVQSALVHIYKNEKTQAKQLISSPRDQVPHNYKNKLVPKQSLRIDLSKLRRQHGLLTVQSVQRKAEQNKLPLENATFRQIQNCPTTDPYQTTDKHSQQQQTENRQKFITSSRQMSDQRTSQQEQGIQSIKNTAKKQANLALSNLPGIIIQQYLHKQFQSLKVSLFQQLQKKLSSQRHKARPIQKINYPLQTHKQMNKQQPQLQQFKTIDNQHSRLIQKQCQNSQDQPASSQKSGSRDNKQNQQNIVPSKQAFQFIKRKHKSGRTIRASSKTKRTNLLQNSEVSLPSLPQALEKVKQNHKQFNKQQERKQDIQTNKEAQQAQFGVNTEVEFNDLKEQLHLLKQMLNQVVSSQNKQERSLSNKKQSYFISKNLRQSQLFNLHCHKNKKNCRINKRPQTQSLRTAGKTLTMRSGSKLSERRSSLDYQVIEKAALRPQNCRQFLEQIYGDPNTLLFNAAIHSVNKKRKSFMLY